jgi:hypothetical protein
VKLEEYKLWIGRLDFGKRLPSAVYIARPGDWGRIPLELAACVQRAEQAACPDPAWNLLKFHTDQIAITFLTYPEFDSDPHPALARATKINLNTGSVVHTDYSGRSNPPILHRKETFLPQDDPRVEEFAYHIDSFAAPANYMNDENSTAHFDTSPGRPRGPGQLGQAAASAIAQDLRPDRAGQAVEEQALHRFTKENYCLIMKLDWQYHRLFRSQTFQ